MDQRRSEPDRNTGGGGPATLYGEFTATGNRKVRCAVSLTERDLVVQRLLSAPVGRSKAVLSLRDSAGCRAHRGHDPADPAAYLSVYFYPLRRRWVGSGASRQRVEHCFRLAAHQDPRANLEEAERWARAIRERSVAGRRRRFLGDGERRLATGGGRRRGPSAGVAVPARVGRGGRDGEARFHACLSFTRVKWEMWKLSSRPD